MKLMKNLLFTALLILTGCATGSHILTGNARAIIAPDGVKIYTAMPDHAEVVGIVNASIELGNGQAATDRVVSELKKQAGLMGANGVCIGTVNSQGATSSTGFGTGFSSGGSSAFGSGFGSTSAHTAIAGTAIFVP